MITTEKIIELIKEDKLYIFYTGKAWRKLRMEILASDHFECQICKARGKYKKATTVHHERHIRKYPGLALSKIYFDENGKQCRQLISLCHSCHEEVHGYRQKEKTMPLTKEMW